MSKYHFYFVKSDIFYLTFKMESITKVKNPKTGRMIAVGKSVYNNLLREGYTLKGDESALQRGVVPFSEKPTTDIISTLLSPMAESQVQQPPPTIGAIPPTAQITIPTQVITTPVQIISPVRPVSPVRVITSPISPIQVIKSPIRGFIPDPTLLQMEMKLLERQEEEEKNRLCKVCDEWYLSRTRNLIPFKVQDYDTLKKITPICGRCSDLCDAKIVRRGFDPRSEPECQKYKNASIGARKRLSEIEAELRGKGIQLAKFTGQDISKFFPSVPQ